MITRSVQHFNDFLCLSEAKGMFINMASRELVGIGATAEIVAWDDGKVVKLFRDPALNDMAAMEYADLKMVWQSGLDRKSVVFGKSVDLGGSRFI